MEALLSDGPGEAGVLQRPLPGVPAGKGASTGGLRDRGELPRSGHDSSGPPVPARRGVPEAPGMLPLYPSPPDSPRG